MDDASKPDSDPLPVIGSAPIRSHDTPADDDGRSPVPPTGRLGAVTPRAPESTGAWLHVVSGASIPALSRAALELAARFLAGGHRVLLMDGAPRLRLHERFDRESRWGVLDCLGSGMPVLGLVQDAGRLGLYLLAHGTPDGTPCWPRLGEVLDEAQPHFGRVILALDPAAPATIGEALSGVHLEGWWPEGGSEARRAAGIGGRLGIQFSGLNLDALLVPRLEALDARVWALLAPPPEAAPEEPARSATTPGGGHEAPEPVRIESDPRVRERLRFLLWMRRVEAEGARSLTAATAKLDASEDP